MNTLLILLSLLVIGCSDRKPETVDLQETHTVEQKMVRETNYSAVDTSLRMHILWFRDTTITCGISMKNGLVRYFPAVDHWSQFDPELIEVDNKTIPARQYEYEAKDCGAMVKISLDSNYVHYEPYGVPGVDCGRPVLFIRDTI